MASPQTPGIADDRLVVVPGDVVPERRLCRPKLAPGDPPVNWKRFYEALQQYAQRGAITILLLLVAAARIAERRDIGQGLRPPTTARRRAWPSSRRRRRSRCAPSAAACSRG